MCGRYTLTLTEGAIRSALPAVRSFKTSWKPSYNISPLQTVPAIISENTETIEGLKWGFTPSGAQSMPARNYFINARCETLNEKPAFRSAYRSRRCLILADGFFEWKKRRGRKIPLYIRLRSGPLFTLAGLWNLWRSSSGEDVRTCAIVTTEANEIIKPFHLRMPVIIRPEDRDRWLDVKQKENSDLLRVTHPYPPREMESYEVSMFVNHAENNSSECIRPVHSHEKFLEFS